MSKTDWATLSNNFVYSSMGIIFIAFISFAFQTAWSFRVEPLAHETVKPKVLNIQKPGELGLH